MMDVRPIRNEEDYEWALGEIAPYFADEPAPGSADADRFDVLAALIKVYEDRQHPIDAPDPVAMLAAHMANAGLRTKDLADVLGSAPRASEILNRRRRITIDMAYRISRAWEIPVELLLRPAADAATRGIAGQPKRHPSRAA